MTKDEMTEAVRGYSSHFNYIDAECAEETPCGECGAQCHYEGFKRGDTYRAFSVCSNGHCEEF